MTEDGGGDLLAEYEVTLANKASGTVEGYCRVLRHLTDWIAQQPGSNGQFQPDCFTRTALETYLAQLETKGYSTSHRTLVKSAASGFARWLIEEKGLLRRNPARGVSVPAQPLLAPRVLTADQRYVLRNLVEREDDLRGAAIFALGYWAGCRVSDVSWLLLTHTNVKSRSGTLKVGHKGGKLRQIDLSTQVCQPLYDYYGGRAFCCGNK